MNPFTDFKPDQLPESANPVLDKTRAAFGFVPNMAAQLALSPVTLNAYLDNLKAFSQTSFSPAEQQLVILAASVETNVPYSVAVHTILGRASALPEETIQAVRDSKPLTDNRLNALVKFTQVAAREGGDVPAEEVAEFVAAGWTRVHMIEILFAISVKTLVFNFQRLAHVPLDEALSSGRWELAS